MQRNTKLLSHNHFPGNPNSPGLIRLASITRHLRQYNTFTLYLHCSSFTEH